MLKTWPLPPTVGLVGADNQDVITIQTSSMTPLSATAFR